MELNTKVKMAIIEQKIEQYKQEYYNLELDMEIAEKVNNIRIADRSLEAMKVIKDSIDVLEEKLAGFEKEEKEAD